MVKRIQLKDSHKQKAKELRIYNRLMKAIENCMREKYPYYMNSKEFIDAYNKHMLRLNNMSWEDMITEAFWWSENDPKQLPESSEEEVYYTFWKEISEHFSK